MLQTIPGIGPQTAATLLGKLGALTRFTDARALVAYVGFYPVINESGDRAAPPRLSPVGSRIARHSLYLAAVNAVRRSGEWRTIYLRKKAQGKTAKQALVVVAVKLLHAVYAMLKHRQPYNPLTSPRRAGDDWVLTSHGMSRWRMAGGESSRTPGRAPASLETFADLLDEIRPELGWHGIGTVASPR